MFEECLVYNLVVDSIHRTTGERERDKHTKVNASLELQLLASTHNGSFLWCIPEVARDAINERINFYLQPTIPYWPVSDWTSHKRLAYAITVVEFLLLRSPLISEVYRS